MPPNLRACFYVLVAIAAGYTLCNMLLRQQKYIIQRITMGWVMVTLVLFLAPSAALYFIGTAIVLLMAAPKNNNLRFQFYIAILPAIPLTAIWRVSIPGIETLLWMDYARVLGLCLLLPVYLQTRQPAPDLNRPYDIRQSDKLFGLLMIYLILTLVLDWRGTNVTSAIRMVAEQFLSVFILVIVARRLCSSREMLNDILFAMMVGGVMLALVSFIEEFTRWKLYNEITSDLVPWDNFTRHIRDYRWGVMRTPVTMTPIPFGYLMAICVVISCYFVGLKKQGIVVYGGSHIITIVLLLGLFFSGSRGAWMTACVMLFVLAFYSPRFKSLRGLVVAGGVVGLFSLSAILTYLAESDPYGTFQYRIDLFSNAMIVMKDSPFFGDVNFITHPALEASKQGEGIIDIVNTYLRIALQYGLLVLILLVVLIFRLLRMLLAYRAEAERLPDHPDGEWQLRVLISLIVGSIFIISTVSMVDRIPHYLWLSMVFGIAVLGKKAEFTSPDTS